MSESNDILVPPSPEEDPKAIVEALEVFVPSGTVTEVRILDFRNGRFTMTVAGYYDDRQKLVLDVLGYASRAKGCYFLLNQPDPSVLARSANRLTERADKGFSTKDNEIRRRRWLPIDIDPVRLSGIPSSDEEHALAHERGREVRDWLRAKGWPDPIYGDSGNGAHLLYRIDLPASDGGVVERCLKALAARFDNERVKVDLSVHNLSRIWRLYGTVNRKGDSIAGRPHRLARLRDVPDRLRAVSP